MPRYMSSREAAAYLRVSLQTLYAYVSRGLLHAENGPGQRESRYLATDVERLRDRKEKGRKPREVAKATLSFGLPVLESAITLIENERLYYRGLDALEIARTHSVEEAAAHLWQCDISAFDRSAPSSDSSLLVVMDNFRGRRAEEVLLPLFTLASDDARTALWQTSQQRLAEGSIDLVRILAGCLLGTEPNAKPLHQQCADVWGIDSRGADLIRRALVLCADHELNASSFTARCVVSTGASLRAGIIGGLAALTGGRHGATTARGEALWDEVVGDEMGTKIRQRLARGDDIPGFGHRLYPSGDVRAADLLASMAPLDRDCQELIHHGHDLTGARPSIDFALVALRRHLRLPLGAAFGVFALGRSIGWIAHGLEQRRNPDIIRPRAAYTGHIPSDVDPHYGVPR
ncbi:citrate synthase family protein [Agrobacterium sp. DKPNP3]|uniref:citrate synthase family protein n=1 Tax=Agrobacterium sp. DKPNP3 TaxID=3457323 RepID=UPI004043CB83